jgi:hypothetical protein
MGETVNAGRKEDFIAEGKRPGTRALINDNMSGRERASSKLHR